jgi:hypothetical protein
MAVQSTSPTGSQQVYLFQPVTPANTPINAPVSQDITLPNYEVQLIRWRVPPGPQGNLGWQLWYSDALILPQNGLWIVADGEWDKMELDELPTAGDWQFVGYNTGSHDHTTYLTFYCNPLTTETPTTLADLGLLGPLPFPSAGNPVTGTVLEP